MDERLRFVARLLGGEKMAALCREFDISRKTGYKIFNRYKDCGLPIRCSANSRLAGQTGQRRWTADPEGNWGLWVYHQYDLEGVPYPEA